LGKKINVITEGCDKKGISIALKNRFATFQNGTTLTIDSFIIAMEEAAEKIRAVRQNGPSMTLRGKSID
jgi:hypothetical protein